MATEETIFRSTYPVNVKRKTKPVSQSFSKDLKVRHHFLKSFSTCFYQTLEWSHESWSCRIVFEGKIWQWTVSKYQIPLNEAIKTDLVSPRPSFWWSGDTPHFIHPSTGSDTITPYAKRQFFNVNKVSSTK